MLWGGEPFDPTFAEVDRIIDSMEVAGTTKYYVKWLGLSYSCCTYETAQDVDNDEKIKQYEKWNTLPTDTKPSILMMTILKKECMDGIKFEKKRKRHQQRQQIMVKMR